ncbi:MAG: hypothetical protein WCO45_10535 [Pseudanabaena sp. ELA607]|jgi:hypothetical protein
MKSKITSISKHRIKYGDDGVAPQLICLIIGVISGFSFYYSAIQILPIITNPLALALVSLLGLVSCVYILLGHMLVTIFDKKKYRIVQRIAGYLSIKRYLCKPKIWSLDELSSVIIEELDDGETLFYSLSLRTGSGEIIRLSNATYGSYDAKKDAEKILSFVGLSIDIIQEEKRKLFYKKLN